MAEAERWFSEVVNPVDLVLDPDNARLQLSESPTQDEIRRKLLEFEEVVDLARSIVSFGGLYPSDNIIITYESDLPVVLEGNRRICSLQLLLNRPLVPKEFEKRFPHNNETLKRQIERITVQVAPSRRAAQFLIARLHALTSRKPWSPLAKMRYAALVYSQDGNLDAVAENLGESRSQVGRLVRRYRIYNDALALGWTTDELTRLSDEKLKATAYLRVFEKSETKDLIGEIYDAAGARITPIDANTLNPHLKQLARDFLLPGSHGEAPPENTRTDLRRYFERQHQELTEAHLSSKGKQRQPGKIIPFPRPRPSPSSPAPAKFFENLWWKVDSDNRLMALCQEIRIIRYEETPIAAAMLLRALLESSLTYHLKRKGLLGDFQAEKKEGLLDLIKFCKTDERVFSEVRVRRQLDNLIQTGLKDRLDFIAHNRFGDISQDVLHTGRAYLRPVIEYIVHHEEE